MSHYKKVAKVTHRRYSPVAAVKQCGDAWARLSPKVCVSLDTDLALRSVGPEWHDFIRMVCCEKGLVSRA